MQLVLNDSEATMKAYALNTQTGSFMVLNLFGHGALTILKENGSESNQEDRHYEQSDYGNDRWLGPTGLSGTFDRDHGYAGQLSDRYRLYR